MNGLIRLWIGMVSKLDRAFAKQGAEIGLFHRRRWIFPRPRGFKWIAAWLDLALDVSRPSQGVLINLVVNSIEAMQPVTDRPPDRAWTKQIKSWGW
jgi:hypothetical protein